LLDSVPPVVNPWFTVGSTWFNPQPSGLYFTDDSLQVWYGAADAGGVKSAWVDAPGVIFRDSLVLPAPTRELQFRFLRFSDALAGEPTLEFRAQDASGNVSAPWTSVPGGLRIRPTVKRIVRSVALGGAEGTDLLTSSPYRMAVMLHGVVDLVSLDAATLVRRLSFAAGVTPQAVELTLGEDTLLVATSDGMLHRLSLATPQAALTSAPLPLETSPSVEFATSMRMTSAGTLMLVARRPQPLATRLTEISLASGTVVRLDSVTTVNGTLERSPDGSRVLMVTMLNCARRWLVATRTLGAPACDITFAPRAVDPSRDRFASGPRVFDASNGQPILSQLPPWIGIGPVAFHPSGESVAQSYGNAVARQRVSDGDIIDRVRLPFSAQFVRVTSDGVSTVLAGSVNGEWSVFIVPWS
jgi:hypothetical protein